VQPKSSFTGARRSDITAHVKLLDRPSACILWIFFDPDTLATPYIVGRPVEASAATIEKEE
jgi:hypothetical protein